MSINATLLIQIVAFVLLIWFVNKVLWGPISKLMEERQKRIADGLSAAEKGKRELEMAEKRAKEVLKEAKEQAQNIIGQAEKRANEIVDDAKTKAQEEADRVRAGAQAELAQEVAAAREQLRSEVAQLAVAGAGQILAVEIDATKHQDIIDRLVKQI